MEALWTNPAGAHLPRSAAARNPRVNGRLGLDPKADPAAWRLAVEGAAGGALTLGLADVQALPAHDLITELRCVEGWTIVVHWTGARLSDFMARYPPAARDGAAADPRDPHRMPPFLALETPGRGYYVGLDLQSALHPQTLLAYAINGQPLSWDHGAPLRLVAPMKYGVKSLKRLGTLRYTFVRPTDFWFERGYDWHLVISLCVIVAAMAMRSRLRQRRRAVTGGAGFIGSNLVDALVARRRACGCATTSRAVASTTSPARATRRAAAGEIRASTTAGATARRPGWMFHLAALRLVPRSWRDRDDNRGQRRGTATPRGGAQGGRARWYTPPRRAIRRKRRPDQPGQEGEDGRCRPTRRRRR